MILTFLLSKTRDLIERTPVIGSTSPEAVTAFLETGLTYLDKLFTSINLSETALQLAPESTRPSSFTPDSNSNGMNRPSATSTELIFNGQTFRSPIKTARCLLTAQDNSS